MQKSERFEIRLSPEQISVLDWLSRELGIDRTSVIRLAINRLAQTEKERLAREGGGTHPTPSHPKSK